MLANTTSKGMHPQQDVSPVAASALKEFELVFDAVYTPMDTQLLQVRLAYSVHSLFSLFSMHQLLWLSATASQQSMRHNHSANTGVKILMVKLPLAFSQSA